MDSSINYRQVNLDYTWTVKNEFTLSTDSGEYTTVKNYYLRIVIIIHS